MYSHTIPLRIDDLINTMAFPVEIVEYALIKSQAIEDGDIEPLYIPDKNSIVLSRITIAAMVDYCYRNIQFRIIKTDDIIEIYRHISSYIDELEKYQEIEEAANYLRKIKRFKQVLNQSINILSKTNTEARTLIFNDSLIDMFKTNLNLNGSET